MDNEAADLFQQGVDDYWSGHVPKNWDNKDKRQRSPYLMGWYMESMFDNGIWKMRKQNR